MIISEQRRSSRLMPAGCEWWRPLLHILCIYDRQEVSPARGNLFYITYSSPHGSHLGSYKPNQLRPRTLHSPRPTRALLSAFLNNKQKSLPITKPRAAVRNWREKQVWSVVRGMEGKGREGRWPGDLEQNLSLSSPPPPPGNTSMGEFRVGISNTL